MATVERDTANAGLLVSAAIGSSYAEFIFTLRQRRARQVVLGLLDRRTARDPFPSHKVPSIEQVSAYETRCVGGPSKDNWMVDPTRNFRSSSWNQKAYALLAEYMLENQLMDASDQRVLEAWFTHHHNHTLRSHYYSLNGASPIGAASLGGRARAQRRDMVRARTFTMRQRLKLVVPAG
ncbi:unnamed protein product [Peniophora sp. CBMAI 1063]|nr:unnamed protein product [Peniophora sp. CBMAI 1063]